MNFKHLRCIMGCFTTPDVFLYAMPKGIEERLSWLTALNLPTEWDVYDKAYVCSRHFPMENGCVYNLPESLPIAAPEQLSMPDILERLKYGVDDDAAERDEEFDKAKILKRRYSPRGLKPKLQSDPLSSPQPITPPKPKESPKENPNENQKMKAKPTTPDDGGKEVPVVALRRSLRVAPSTYEQEYLKHVDAKKKQKLAASAVLVKPNTNPVRPSTIEPHKKRPAKVEEARMDVPEEQMEILETKIEVLSAEELQRQCTTLDEKLKREVDDSCGIEEIVWEEEQLGLEPEGVKADEVMNVLTTVKQEDTSKSIPECLKGRPAKMCKLDPEVKNRKITQPIQQTFGNVLIIPMGDRIKIQPKKPPVDPPDMQNRMAVLKPIGKPEPRLPPKVVTKPLGIPTVPQAAMPQANHLLSPADVPKGKLVFAQKRVEKKLPTLEPPKPPEEQSEAVVSLSLPMAIAELTAAPAEPEMNPKYAEIMDYLHNSERSKVVIVPKDGFQGRMIKVIVKRRSHLLRPTLDDIEVIIPKK